jgi:hypothetical protein
VQSSIQPERVALLELVRHKVEQHHVRLDAGGRSVVLSGWTTTQLDEHHYLILTHAMAKELDMTHKPTRD